MNLRQAVDLTQFEGILVFGDVHGEGALFSKALDFALDNNLFMVSLGDLVDGGIHPYFLVESVFSYLNDKSMALVWGNHDDKHYRYAIGKNVKFSSDALMTLGTMDDRENKLFTYMYREIFSHPLTSHYIYLDDFYFVHAAPFSRMFSHISELTDSEKARCIYGKVSQERAENGYYIRDTSWVNDIPTDKTVIVGHDYEAVGTNKRKEDLLLATNNANGTTVFLDTGCGKSFKGPLTSLILKEDSSGKYQISGNISFSY